MGGLGSSLLATTPPQQPRHMSLAVVDHAGTSFVPLSCARLTQTLSVAIRAPEVSTQD